jgi:hypothetical protein
LARQCGYDFISLYHLLIPPFYKIFGDWILAAQSISFIFGTCAVIPFYFTLRHFFQTRISFIASLAFAVNPFFVSYSVELVKDPIFWFFALLGIFFFIAALKGEEALLPAFSTLFLIAGLLFRDPHFIGSLLFIIPLKRKRRKDPSLFCTDHYPAVLVNVLNAYLLKETLYSVDIYFCQERTAFSMISSGAYSRPISSKNHS